MVKFSGVYIRSENGVLRVGVVCKRAPERRMEESVGGDECISVPYIRIGGLRESRRAKVRRKQEHPNRALKQLASVADKILHGIIVIEPFLPWETRTPLRRPVEFSTRTDRSRRKRSSRSDDDGASDSSLGSPRQGQGQGQSSNSTRPTVSRSPAPMGNLLPEDTIEPGVSHRSRLYEAIVTRRRAGTSRAGMPLNICAAPGASLIDDSEFEICSTLRLYPLQYFQSRETLIRNYNVRGFYKKSAAQKMLHIDVNKTGKLYDYFVSRGWMPASPSAVDLASVQSPHTVDWSMIEP